MSGPSPNHLDRRHLRLSWDRPKEVDERPDDAPKVAIEKRPHNLRFPTDIGFPAVPTPAIERQTADIVVPGRCHDGFAEVDVLNPCPV